MHRLPGGTGRLCLVFLIAAIHFAPHAVHAQIESATLRGVVSDSNEPRADVRVVATNTGTGRTRQTTTTGSGAYTIVGLEPGTYTVAVADAPPGSGETLTLRLGQRAVLDFELGGSRMDEVVVVGTRVSTFSGGEVGTSITPELIDRLPQVNRNFLAFADLAPGVRFTQRNDGSAVLRGGAQHQRAVNVFIDGVSQKDYVLKGGVTGQDTSRGNPFPQSAIGEYKIITQNYKAEFESVSSAAVTAVTASGTNEFSGSVFYDYTDDSLRAATPLENTEGGKVASEQEQYGLTFSGPIVRDRLHFLLAYEVKDNLDPLDVTPGGIFTSGGLPNPYAQLTGRDISQFEEDLLFGKIDWTINDVQDIELSLKYRDESAVQGFGGINARPYGTSVDQEDTRFQLKHTWSADRWQNEFRITHQDATWNPRPLTGGNGVQLFDSSQQGILNTGGGQNRQDKGQKGWTVRNDVTLLDLNWLGEHEIKTGVSYREIELHTLQQLPANPQYLYNVEFNGPGTFELVQPYRLEVGVAQNPRAGALTSDNTQIGFYIQDDWSPTDRLTLNLGVRWDYEETPSYEDFVTPGAIVQALETWPALQGDVAGAYDIGDYISTGSERDPEINVSPRLGFSYQLDKDGLHTLYGGYGRSYDRNQFDFLQLEATRGTFARVTYNFEGDPDNPCGGDNCLPWDDAYLTAQGRAALIAGTPGGLGAVEINLLPNELETPYSDQYSLGVRSNWGDWETDLTLSRVESRNGFNWLLGNRREDGSFFAPGTSFGAPFGFSPPGFGNLLLAGNDLETEANSLLLKVERPHADNWGISFAYTYTDAEENRKFDDTFSLDYPTVDGYGFRDATGIATHRLVVTGSYDLPWDIRFTGKLSADSGVAFQYLDTLNGFDQATFERLEPDDAEFRQFDLSLAKDFATDFLADDSSLQLRLDVINVFNTRNWINYDLNPGDAATGRNPNFGHHLDSVSATRTAKLSVAYNF